MVLIVRAVEPPPDGRPRPFHCSANGKNRILFDCGEHDTRRGVEHEYVIDGQFVDTREESDPKKEPVVNLGILPAQVQSAAAARGSVLVLNRGTPGSNSSHFFLTLVDTLLLAISPTAERALQIVADEIAKEKQMQRLMLGDQEGTTPAPAAPPVVAAPKASINPVDTVLVPETPKSTRDLSLPLRQALKSASRKRDEHSPGRFSIYTSTADHLLKLPEHNRALTARGFEVKPPPPEVPSPASARDCVSLEGSMSMSHTISLRSRSMTQAERQRHEMMRRKSSMRLVKELTAHEADPVIPIKGNGWGEEMMFYEFDGISSFMQLPPLPQLDSLIKAFRVDFWLATDCKVREGRKTILHIGDGSRADVGMCFAIGLNWYTDFEEGLRLYIRDASNRVLECIVPFWENTSNGELHHISLHVINLEDCRVEAFIDDRQVERIRFLQTEHPGTFNSWISHLFIGGTQDETGSPVHILRGSVVELRFWEHNAPNPIIRWPLNGPTTPNGTLVEATRTVPADHMEILHNMRQVVRQAPVVCPVFDGGAVINMGPMGIFGDFMNHWSFEITFRTTVTGRCMSLLGVTDSQHKQMELGLILNAEPTISKELYRLHEYNITFLLGDCTGTVLSALIRGSEHNNVMDGKWHTILLKVVDAEQGKIDVHIDGLSREVINVMRNYPRHFIPFRDWICVGGHNVRGWKQRNAFEGQIRSCIFQVRGEDFSVLDFCEGPGAHIMQDKCGRHNHGILQDLETGQPRRHSMDWALFVEKEEVIDPTDPNSASHRATTEHHSSVTIHKNNKVSAAVVQFGGKMVDGRMEEQLWDALQRKEVELVESLVHMKGSDPLGFGGWLTLPDNAFKQVDSVPTMREMIKEAVESTPLEDNHTLVICRIGDCFISILNISGPHYNGNITFDTTLVKWVPHTVATDGAINKRMMLLNDSYNGLQRCLMEMTCVPHIVHKLGPINQPHHRITATALVSALTEAGIHWRLALAVQCILMNVEFNSAIHFVETTMLECTEDDVLSIVRLQEALRDEAKGRAAIYIQRNWRRKLARLHVARLVELKRVRRQRVEEIMALRKTNPLVLPKKGLRAIVITLQEYTNPILDRPSNASAADDILVAFGKQGYAVEHVCNPTRSQLLKVLSTVEGENSTFVYISGYGGLFDFRLPPPFALDRAVMSMAEEAGRESVVLAALEEYHKLYCRFLDERWDIREMLAAKPKKKKKKGNSPRPPSRSKANAKQAAAALALQQQQMQNEFRVAREEMENAETESRLREVAAAEENARIMLAGEMVRVIRSLQDQNRRGPKDVFSLMPCDVKHAEPYSGDVIPVSELIQRSLLQPMPPMGFQGVIAIDLASPSPSVPGGAFLACSTGHSFSFPYRHGQHSLLSWVLEKALNGHVPRIPIKNKESYLCGAVETTGSGRDWRSFGTYIAPRVAKMCRENGNGTVVNDNSSISKDTIVQMLDKEVTYSADVVPLRNIPFDEEARERRRRERELKRVISTAIIAVEASRVMPDMGYEFRPLLRHTNISDIAPMSSLLFVLAQHNAGMDNVILSRFHDECQKLIPNLTFKLSMTPQGLLLEVPQGGAEHSKIIQQLHQLASKSHTLNIHLEPYAAVRFAHIDHVKCLYSVRVSTTMRKHHQQKKEIYCGLPTPPHVLFMSYGEDK